MPSTPDRVRLTPGVELGPFRLEQKLALGGMAEIWTAWHQTTRVALKILLPHYATEPGFRAMFQDEVNIATRLKHPNIVEVFGAYDESGHLFQMMELIEGRDLRRVLSQVARAGSRIPVPIALAVGRDLARALGYAHGRRGEDGRPLSIVHRDVSPHNVMISDAGQVKLLDFGIARAAERLARTRTGVIKGKVSYMAPEQALAVGVTPQTDIFAAGVVLWEMLAMQRLFRAATDAEALELVVRAEVPPIQDFNPDVPKDAAELLARMLQQRAPNRPDSMREVELILARVLNRLRADFSEADMAAWLMPYFEERPRTQAPRPAEDPATKSEPSPVVSEIEADFAPGDPTPLESAALDEALEPTDTTVPTPAVRVQEDPSQPLVVSDPSQPIHDPSQPTLTMAPVDRLSAPPVQVANVDLTLPVSVVDAPSPVGLASVSSPTLLAQSPEEMWAQGSPSPGTPSPNVPRIRLPTRSEIMRAVENQATVPVVADARYALREPRVEPRIESRAEPPRRVPSPETFEPLIVREVASADIHTPAEVVPPTRLTPPPTPPSVKPAGPGILPWITLGLAVVVIVLLALLLTRT